MGTSWVADEGTAVSVGELGFSVRGEALRGAGVLPGVDAHATRLMTRRQKKIFFMDHFFFHAGSQRDTKGFLVNLRGPLWKKIL
jgi:hypothetical protein